MSSKHHWKPFLMTIINKEFILCERTTNFFIYCILSTLKRLMFLPKDINKVIVINRKYTQHSRCIQFGKMLQGTFQKINKKIKNPRKSPKLVQKAHYIASCWLFFLDFSPACIKHILCRAVFVVTIFEIYLLLFYLSPFSSFSLQKQVFFIYCCAPKMF